MQPQSSTEDSLTVAITIMIYSNYDPELYSRAEADMAERDKKDVNQETSERL